MTFKSIRRVALAACWAVSAAHAQQSATGTSLTLAQALALTLEKSPELVTSSWDVRAAEARIIQARLIPNPEVNMMSENIAGTGEYADGQNAEHTLQLSQLVQLGGKRSARVSQAQWNRVLADYDYQVKRVSVLRDTTMAFVDVLVAQRRVELAEQTLELWRNAIPLTEKRVTKGAAPQVELTRASVAVDVARITLDQNRHDLTAAKAALASQWGENRNVPFARVVGNLDRTEPMPSFANLAGRLANHPQLARWTAEREHRQAMLHLQKTQRIPDLTVGVGPRQVGGGDGYTIGVISFTLPLPIFNRNQGNIAEAEAFLQRAGPEEKGVQARAFAELSAAYQTMTRAGDTLKILRESILPSAAKSVELLSEGYTAGRFSQLEILDARRTLADVRDRYLLALADYHKAVANVEALTAQPVELHGHLSTSGSKAISRTKATR